MRKRNWIDQRETAVAKPSRKRLDSTAVKLLNDGVSFKALTTTLELQGRRDLTDIVLGDGFVSDGKFPVNYIFTPDKDTGSLLYNLFLKEAILSNRYVIQSTSLIHIVRWVRGEGPGLGVEPAMNVDSKYVLDCLFIDGFYSTTAISNDPPFTPYEREYIEENLIDLMNLGASICVFVDTKKTKSLENWYSPEFLRNLMETAVEV